MKALLALLLLVSPVLSSDLAEVLITLEKETAAHEARTWPRPPLPGEAVPGQAWDWYRKAMALLDLIDKRMEEETT